jgi:hypothetical protein
MHRAPRAWLAAPLDTIQGARRLENTLDSLKCWISRSWAIVTSRLRHAERDASF